MPLYFGPLPGSDTYAFRALARPEGEARESILAAVRKIEDRDTYHPETSRASDETRREARGLWVVRIAYGAAHATMLGCRRPTPSEVVRIAEGTW